MNELERKIVEMIGTSWTSDIKAVSLFISRCSLSEFEKLKDLEYELNIEDVQKP